MVYLTPDEMHLLYVISYHSVKGSMAQWNWALFDGVHLSANETVANNNEVFALLVPSQGDNGKDEWWCRQSYQPWWRISRLMMKSASPTEFTSSADGNQWGMVFKYEVPFIECYWQKIEVLLVHHLPSCGIHCLFQRSVLFSISFFLTITSFPTDW